MDITVLLQCNLLTRKTYPKKTTKKNPTPKKISQFGTFCLKGLIHFHERTHHLFILTFCLVVWGWSGENCMRMCNLVLSTATSLVRVGVIGIPDLNQNC